MINLIYAASLYEITGVNRNAATFPQQPQELKDALARMKIHETENQRLQKELEELKGNLTASLGDRKIEQELADQLKLKTSEIEVLKKQLTTQEKTTKIEEAKLIKKIQDLTAELKKYQADAAEEMDLVFAKTKEFEALVKSIDADPNIFGITKKELEFEEQEGDRVDLEEKKKAKKAKEDLEQKDAFLKEAQSAQRFIENQLTDIEKKLIEVRQSLLKKQQDIFKDAVINFLKPIAIKVEKKEAIDVEEILNPIQNILGPLGVIDLIQEGLKTTNAALEESVLNHLTHAKIKALEIKKELDNPELDIIKSRLLLLNKGVEFFNLMEKMTKSISLANIIVLSIGEIVQNSPNIKESLESIKPSPTDVGVFEIHRVLEKYQGKIKTYDITPPKENDAEKNALAREFFSSYYRLSKVAAAGVANKSSNDIQKSIDQLKSYAFVMLLACKSSGLDPDYIPLKTFDFSSRFRSGSFGYESVDYRPINLNFVLEALKTKPDLLKNIREVDFSNNNISFSDVSTLHEILKWPFQGSSATPSIKMIKNLSWRCKI